MPAHTSEFAGSGAYHTDEESSNESEEDQEDTIQMQEKKHSVKMTSVTDDGTQSFFWRAHSVTVLFFMLAVFLYVALIEEPENDINFNTKRGIIACIVVFCLFGMTQTKDGPFSRPHPALWRLVLCFSIVYELALVYLLFQSLDNARQLMKHFDPSLGKSLPEQSYAEDCRFYDPSSHSGGHFHNLWEKCDVFVLGHFFGWWAKMLIIRDYWLCNVISILFEVMEYTLEHQLPNFAECWWDHWLLDVLICNGLGIWIGMKTLNYLNASTYHWRGLWSINTYSGKLKRIVMQFTPYSWTEFEWHPTESLSRWIYVVLMAFFFLLAELNCFYLKYVLWLPPPHFLNFSRLFLYVPVGAVAIREVHQYLNDAHCYKLGQQAWVAIAMVVTEFLIVLKFDLPLILTLPPTSVIVFWGCFMLVFLVWTAWFFFIRPYRKYKRKQLMKSKKERFSRRARETRTTSTTRSTVSYRSKDRTKDVPLSHYSSTHSVTSNATNASQNNGRYASKLRSRMANGQS